VPLSQQHHNGLALCVLTNRSLEGEVSEETVARLASKVVDRYDMVIANHFAIEEELVFPTVERELGEYPQVGEFIAEHRRLEEIVDRLRSAPDAGTLRTFTSLLRTHIRREEDEFFEDIQRRLPRGVLDALGAQIDARAVRLGI
jgi:hemerythrin-like domain-containing protein